MVGKCKRPNRVREGGAGGEDREGQKKHSKYRNTINILGRNNNSETNTAVPLKYTREC